MEKQDSIFRTLRRLTSTTRWSAFSLAGCTFYIYLYLFSFSLLFRSLNANGRFARSVRNAIKRGGVARESSARSRARSRGTKTRREKDDCALLGAMNARETRLNPGRSFRERAPRAFIRPGRRRVASRRRDVFARHEVELPGRQFQTGVARRDREGGCRNRASVNTFTFLGATGKKCFFLWMYMYILTFADLHRLRITNNPENRRGFESNLSSAPHSDSLIDRSLESPRACNICCSHSPKKSSQLTEPSESAALTHAASASLPIAASLVDRRACVPRSCDHRASHRATSRGRAVPCGAFARPRARTVRDWHVFRRRKSRTEGERTRDGTRRAKTRRGG